MTDAKTLLSIQVSFGLSDQNILDWAKDVQRRVDERWKDRLPEELLAKVQANIHIMHWVRLKHRAMAANALRKSGITDMTLRENLLVIDKVMKRVHV